MTRAEANPVAGMSASRHVDSLESRAEDGARGLRELLPLQGGLYSEFSAQIAVRASLLDLLRQHERDFVIQTLDFCRSFCLRASIIDWES